VRRSGPAVPARLIATGFLLAAAAGTLVFFLIPRDTARAWTGEPGPLHYATVILYVTVAAGYLFRETRRLPAAAGAGGLLLLAAIKLDPGDWLRIEKAEPLAFYTSAETPVLRKILVGGAFLAAAVLLVVTAGAGWRGFRAGLRNRRTAPTLVATAVFLLGASLVLDYVQGAMTWPRPGYHTHPRIFFGVGAAEAVVELLVPGALLGALALAGKDRLSRPDGGAQS
jgi:hypothetical protein